MLRPLGGGSGHGVERDDKETSSTPRVDEERAYSGWQALHSLKRRLGFILGGIGNLGRALIRRLT